MKKILYMVIALGMLSTFAEARWLKLSYEQCNRYAGDGVKKNGVARPGDDAGCFTGFERAKRICRRAGGKIPSRNDFKRLASQCGFRFTEYGGKLSSKSRKCLIRKGFSRNIEGGAPVEYWTRNKQPGVVNYMTTVDLVNIDFSFTLSYAGEHHLMCVK